ncbi:GAF domain-containing sensor histidine kinase [Lichenifustis flavocetrariae]|uniref:histidine kinase n=1 Tax=Lichenifustis flavocetrariae TaxID=2949735 RepID=A0AA41Z1V4_9HYPH|nr:GAF domain-containing sensor histidine kinase [Lichenifustis flavocetrariae]MCW6512189.1 GAF domain-containing sensor histidine kinase [Lichenifustis flavocetrariae]
MSSQREIPTKPHDFQGDIDTIGRIDAVSTILDVVCRTTGMGFAAVARVTEERWIACQVLDNIDFGLGPGGELKVESTICHEIRQNREAVVISNVADDPVYCSHHTPLAYGFQSYISMPIMLKDKTFFGTLCAIDPRPARLNNPETIGMFKLFAELIAAHIETDRQLRTSQAALVQERQLSELREQFIAVLGHDLRNPVASVDSGARLLSRQPLNDKGRQILAMMQGSVTRMSGLIDNVLDFARARLGNGLDLVLEGAKPLRPVLEQVVNELASVDPSREIMARFDFDADRAIAVDHVRIAQLFSNLLGNALTHGEPGAPVRVGAGTEGDAFVLWVANAGTPIPPATLDDLFRPFFRGKARPSQQGLGLGLYIASEIAKAHGGTLVATSDTDETRFTFRMPLEAKRGQTAVRPLG